MYNRYIPQPDGSFRRNRISDPTPPQPQPVPPPPVQEPPQWQPPAPPPPPKPRSPTPRRPAAPRQEKAPDSSVGTFLKQLLPKDFDTEDLLIVLLLLLMSADSREDQNHALLTLMLYLFL